MPRRKGKMGRTKTVGFGWVGRWWGNADSREEGEATGTLGWAMPPFLDDGAANINLEDWAGGTKVYLCQITVKQVFDKRGRPIVRRVPRSH